MELSQVLGVINSPWKEIVEIRSKGVILLGKVTVEGLVEENEIYQTIMNNDRLSVFQQLCEEISHAQRFVILEKQ